MAHHGDHLVGHVARDSTAIEARERPARRPRAPAEPKRKRGRPRKGKERKTPPPERRLERQPGHLAEMTAELPRDCARGVKQNAQGYRIHWTGYKLHIDTADGDIPLSAILTSANTHDSQAAIPLATMTAMRVTSLYDLMDNAYDAAEIKAHSRSLGHVPIIAPHPRGTVRKAEQLAEAKRRRSTGWYPPRRSPLPAARCRRTRQRQLQGQLRRPPDPLARRRQDRVPLSSGAHRHRRHPDRAAAGIDGERLPPTASSSRRARKNTPTRANITQRITIGAIRSR